MPTISSTIKMLDGMTGPIKAITTSMNLMIRTFEQMQDVTERNQSVSRMLTAAKEQISSAEAEIMRQIEQSEKAQKKFNHAVNQGKSNTDGLLRSVKNVAAAYLSFQSVKAIANITDEYVNTYARLDMINDGLQTTAKLQEKIFAAADRARGTYSNMADAVARMGLLASDAFKGTEEIVAFTELMQKVFKISGTDIVGQQAAMYQLSQAMASGRLQGDEYVTIMENATFLAEKIAEALGVTKGELKKMSSEGKITSGVIKYAMFSAADEINERFESMPVTFGDVINRMKNYALQEFGPALQYINNMLNDPKMERSMQGVGKAISAAAVAAVWLLDVVGKTANFISTNWSMIEPIVWGIATAFGAWLLVTRLQAITQGLLAVKTAVMTAAMIGQIAATQGLAAAWRMLNAAQKANIFVFLISAIIALVLWIVNLWKTNDQFAAALMRAWNAILNFFDQVLIFFVKVGMGIINAFQWAKVESLKLMEDLINGVIDGVNWLIEKLNRIPGVSIDAIGQVEFAAKAAAEAEAIRQAGEEMIALMETEAARKAAEREQKVLDFLENRAAKRAQKEAEQAAKQGYEGYDFSQWQRKPDIGKVDEVGKISDTVDISSEDLKMMRELAEMKSIQNFVSLRPSVRVQTGPISKEVDVETVIARIEEALTEQIASSAKGVFRLV